MKLRQAVPPRERPPGALALDLHDADEARAAARLLVARQARRARTAPMPACWCSARSSGRANLACAWPTIRRSARSSRSVPGGTAADGTRDLAMDLPPLNLPLAHGLIGRCRVGALLGQSLRDLPAADEAAVAEVLVRISQLIVDWPEIAELEVPALFADAAGVTAADAWLRLRAADEPPAVLAIAPYPVGAGGAVVRRRREFRRPADPPGGRRAACGVLLTGCRCMDVRYRFFSTMRELSQEQMARLTQVDYDREMAFIAVREATGETVGVARLVREPGGRSGEFAVIVQPDVKGHGLGEPPDAAADRLGAAVRDGRGGRAGPGGKRPDAGVRAASGLSPPPDAGGAGCDRGEADFVIPARGMHASRSGVPFSSWPGLTRPSTPVDRARIVPIDGAQMAGSSPAMTREVADRRTSVFLRPS